MDNNPLLNLIEQQIEHLVQLHTLLKDELTVIASRNGEQLKTLTPQKSSAINDIQRLDKQISQVTARMEQLDDDQQGAISRARKLLEQCQQQNKVNAQAAHHAQLSVSQLKEILIGSPSSKTYGADGGMKNANQGIVKNLKA